MEHKNRSDILKILLSGKIIFDENIKLCSNCWVADFFNPLPLASSKNADMKDPLALPPWSLFLGWKGKNEISGIFFLLFFKAGFTQKAASLFLLFEKMAYTYIHRQFVQPGSWGCLFCKGFTEQMSDGKCMKCLYSEYGKHVGSLRGIKTENRGIRSAENFRDSIF